MSGFDVLANATEILQKHCILPYPVTAQTNIPSNCTLCEKQLAKIPSTSLFDRAKIRLKSLLVLRTRGYHPTSRKSANGIPASNPLRQNQSFVMKFLVPSQKLKSMLKYCSYLRYFLINRLQRYPSSVVYMFRQISYLEPELRAFTGQKKVTFLRKFK